MNGSPLARIKGLSFAAVMADVQKYDAAESYRWVRPQGPDGNGSRIDRTSICAVRSASQTLCNALNAFCCRTDRQYPAGFPVQGVPWPQNILTGRAQAATDETVVHSEPHGDCVSHTAIVTWNKRGERSAPIESLTSKALRSFPSGMWDAGTRGHPDEIRFIIKCISIHYQKISSACISHGGPQH